ncbi:hypothetical protein psal_cds_130 [Pandoravirus salinus]|uniref:Uncharacterized protein n=1 Tax=Pandoravirus salinus TaxID=1349410 RepID=S4VT14_9VIRU|nr:hypothetical protein psal_cds_130 [Pandoravirus salinus]AGO83584.2 hypothetical protein psal_cds_130 [Pandoravirus salinus]
MKSLIGSATGRAPAYELVDMTRAARIGSGDADDPRHSVDSMADDPIDSDNGLGRVLDIESTDRPPRDVATGLCARIVRAAFWLLVAVGAMAMVLGLFYLGFVRPRLAPVERMVPTECNITSHVLISTMTADDGTGNQYIPGLGVRFTIERGGGDDSGAPTTREAIARPRIRRDESWMVAAERDAYLGRFTVGTVARCYYSREEHNFVTMSDESDALRHVVMWGIALATVASVVVFCCCGLLVVVEAEEQRRRRVDVMSRAVAARA